MHDNKIGGKQRNYAAPVNKLVSSGREGSIFSNVLPSSCFPTASLERDAIIVLWRNLEKDSSSNSLFLQAINVVLIEIIPFLQATAIITHKR